MITPLLFKEWIKLRLLAWLPLALVMAALVDSWLVLRAVRNNHGPVQLWNALTYKQDIYFFKLAYVLPLSGLWYACVQFLPECTGKRLRLLFHLPVPHWLALYVPVTVGLACVAAVSVVALGGLGAILALGLHLPAELSWPMVQTALPWCLAALVAYLATAATIADPGPVRRLAIALAGLAFVSMLIQTSGFAGMSDSLPWYGLACLPWLLPLEAAALRVKEGH